MNLKEAFRYQKFLDNMLTIASNSIVFNSTYTEYHHKRKSVVPSSEDVVEFIYPNGYEEKAYNCDDMLHFASALITEKYKLTHAINVAKSELDIDLDALVESNKMRRTLAEYISRISSCRETEVNKPGAGEAYTFNNENNQVPYRYDIINITHLNFDKKLFKNKQKDLIMCADQMSTKIEAIMVNTKVVYAPIYDVNSTFEDLMTEYVSVKESSESDSTNIDTDGSELK